MSFTDSLYRNLLLPPVRYATRNDAEVAHEWLVSTLTRLQRHPKLLETVLPKGAYTDERLAQVLMNGLTFPNPFGTAAGFDKAGSIYPSLARLTGVGNIELGGVTLKPQPGNARPRLVRVDKDHLINAMGFPGEGVDAMVKNIRAQVAPMIPLGVQIVKNKSTSDEDAAAEYGELIRAFAGVVSNGRRLPNYYVVNVSSPNTPGLRALADVKPLSQILASATEALDEQTELADKPRHRLLIKLSPELTEPEIESTIGLVEQFDIGGIILTNTTTTRPVPSKHDDRPGGFSGSALYGRSSRHVKFAAGLLKSNRVLVATGGVDTTDRAYETLQYADLVAGYTGLVLKSPNLFRTIAAEVVERMKADGVNHVSELRAGNRPS